IRKSANKYAVLDEDNEFKSLLTKKKEVDNEVIDVYEETSGSARKMSQNEIGSSYVDVLNGTNEGGLGKVSKENVVKNLIVDEKLNICAVLETRIKGINVKKVGDRLFGKWSWYDNALECSRGCRILIGWDNNKIQFIMGDLNVSLNQDDQSEGIFGMTQDIEDFRDCINTIKMKDICSSGLHFIWIKSLLNLNASILKKIDRVMGNEKFLEDHLRAHVVFLPYGISDHNPVVLSCPQLIKLKSRSFRFANYTADKDHFLDVVKDNWKTEVDGFAMFKLVKKLKAMKPALNKLNWKNGNLFENGVSVVHEYTLALEDEEKLPLQKTKVEWLKEGDRNFDFSHKVLKGKTNRSRVKEICREDNVRYSGDQVPTQFVKHFQMFLGEHNIKECLDLDENLFSKKIDSQEANRMIGEVTNEEIKYAIFDIDDNKAAGPDGYTAKFFKNS
ncbi:RNA-directed DNA polymerase, eukaryota, reverse transcriptase zinc-binding domain protein, partial [Tanacetum coccineum]